MAGFFDLPAKILEEEVRFFKLIKNFLLLIDFISVVDASDLKSRCFRIYVHAFGYIVLAAR